MTDEQPIIDPLLRMEVTVTMVQPYQAKKVYMCPGCHNEIQPGTGHFVAIPVEAADLRRHWHKPCWNSALKKKR